MSFLSSFRDMDLLYLCEQMFLMIFVLETLVRWYIGFNMFWRVFSPFFLFLFFKKQSIIEYISVKCALESVFSLARYFVAPEHPIIQISKHNFMVLLSKTADTVSLNDRWNIMNLLITLALFVGHRVTSDPDTFTVFRCGILKLKLLKATIHK